MSTATISMPKSAIKRYAAPPCGADYDDAPELLKEFWRISDANYRDFLAMGFNDETIEEFIDEVIHEGREIN